MAQWTKDLLRFRLLLWHRFTPQPGNFHMLWAQPRKQNKTKHSHYHRGLCFSKRAYYSCHLIFEGSSIVFSSYKLENQEPG